MDGNGDSPDNILFIYRGNKCIPYSFFLLFLKLFSSLDRDGSLTYFFYIVDIVECLSFFRLEYLVVLESFIRDVITLYLYADDTASKFLNFTLQFDIQSFYGVSVH